MSHATVQYAQIVGTKEQKSQLELKSSEELEIDKKL
jgi:hypothetical protein